jgi:hypothetical protein
VADPEEVRLSFDKNIVCLYPSSVGILTSQKYFLVLSPILLCARAAKTKDSIGGIGIEKCPSEFVFTVAIASGKF